MTQYILEFLCKTLPDGSILLTAFHCDHISWSPPLFISPLFKNTSPLLQNRTYPHLFTTPSFRSSTPTPGCTFGLSPTQEIRYSLFQCPLSYPRTLNCSPLPLYTSFILSPALFLLLIPFFFLSISHSVLHSSLLS